MGEPLGGDEVLAGAVGGVHVTPLSTSAVHCIAVALDDAPTVPEGEAGALAPTVGEGGGGLCVLHRQAGSAECQGSQNNCLGKHDGFRWFYFGSQECAGTSADLLGLYQEGE